MKTYTKVTIVLVLIPILIAIYLLFRFTNKNEFVPNNDINNIYTLEKKGVNEYTPVSVSNQELAEIYFNSYLTMMINDIEKAYSYLEVNYRESNYISLNSFKDFVKNLTNNYTTIPKMDRYKIDVDDSHREIYSIKSTSDIEFVFITDGVMNYQVYFK